MALPSTHERVPANTADHVNEHIRGQTAERIRRLAGSPSAIGERLKQLREEWDIERAIELNASAIAFAGVAFGYFLHPYWLALPALVTAFLFQHALQGWCPPVPVLRRMGFRTADEVGKERMALKALRGDFEQVSKASDKSSAALQAAEAG
jgi:hypothetical protein